MKNRNDGATARQIFLIRGHTVAEWVIPHILSKEKRMCRDAAKILNDFLEKWEEQSND